jgi:tetratricopeptide (TPR) repeat protein
LNDRYGIAIELSNLGVVALHRGNYPRARALLEESLSLSRALGHKHNDIIVLCNLGLLSMLEGSDLPAREWFKESLALASGLGDKQNIAACLEGLAAIAGRRNQPARAARLYGAAETLRDRIGAPLLVPDREHYQQMTAHARAQLDQAAFRAAWTEGEAMSLEQAIAEGLTEEGLR